MRAEYGCYSCSCLHFEQTHNDIDFSDKKKHNVSEADEV